MKLGPVLLVVIALVVVVPANAQTILKIATVSNPDMKRIQALSGAFTSENPDIKLEWVTLDENTLRQRVRSARPISTGGSSNTTPSWHRRRATSTSRTGPA